MFHFALAAAGQEGEHLDLQRNAHRLAHLGTLRLLRQHVGERMPDIIHRHTGLPVQLRLMREQHQHVRYRALDFVDALAAPRPDRRADVVDGGNAVLFENELQIEVEVRRVHRDEQVRAVGQEIFAQPAADADDLAIVAQHLDVAAHRQLFHREQDFHADGLHPGATDANELYFGARLFQRGHQVAAQQVAGGFARDDADYDFFLLHGETLYLKRQLVHEMVLAGILPLGNNSQKHERHEMKQRVASFRETIHRGVNISGAIRFVSCVSCLSWTSVFLGCATHLTNDAALRTSKEIRQRLQLGMFRQL